MEPSTTKKPRLELASDSSDDFSPTFVQTPSPSDDVTLCEPFADTPVKCDPPFHSDTSSLNEIPSSELCDAFEECDVYTNPFHLLQTESNANSERSDGSPLSTQPDPSVSSEPNFGSLDLEDPFESGSFDPFIDPLSSSLDSDEKLYPGCTLGVVQTLAILFSWFTAFGGISKEAFGRLLHLLHNFILPKGNTLPGSYSQAHALIKPFILPCVEYHCCVNDCILYRKEYQNYTVCPICGEDRYEAGTQQTRKRFKYIPLTPRFRRLYGNKTMAKLLQEHKQPESEIIDDLHQSEAWKQWYGSDGLFANNERALSLGICTDGLNPFAHEKVSYSMWPITLTLLNLPRRVRMLLGSLMLVGIIPGKCEPKTTDPYLEVVVDELLELYDSTIYDIHKNENFHLKADILLHVFDYPGQNKVFHCQGANAYAGCTYCVSTGEYAKSLSKMVYLGHRNFLPADHPLHKDRRNFPHKLEQPKLPDTKTMAYIDDANGKYLAAETEKDRKELAQQTGCKGTYALRALPGHDRVLNTPVDPMHLIKNVADHIIQLLYGTEDSYKVRLEEMERQRFRSAWIQDSDQRKTLPDAPFTLTKEQQKLANQRAISIKVPSHYDWKPRALFTRPMRMKSHEYKLCLCDGILKYCIRGMLGKKQRQTLFKFCDIVSRLCAEQINKSQIKLLEAELHEVLALLERDFPVSLQVIVFHLMHHLPMFLKRYGPVYGFWMYPLERFNSWISQRVTNRRYPESTVIETYRLFEWSHFLQITNQLPDGATTNPPVEGYTVSDIQSEEAAIPSVNDTIQLDLLQTEHLDLYYQSAVEEYRELCSRYKEKYRKAATRHRLRLFPSMANWVPQCGPPLTDLEKELCKGPADSISTLKQYKFKDRFGRVVTFSSELSDRVSSRCSSYTFIRKSDKLFFGRIRVIFQHIFCGLMRTLAYVTWYDGYTRDEESGLIYVDTDSEPADTINTVISVKELSKPLVIAVDVDDQSKIWILNYQA